MKNDTIIVFNSKIKEYNREVNTVGAEWKTHILVITRNNDDEHIKDFAINFDKTAAKISEDSESSICFYDKMARKIEKISEHIYFAVIESRKTNIAEVLEYTKSEEDTIFYIEHCDEGNDYINVKMVGSDEHYSNTYDYYDLNRDQIMRLLITTANFPESAETV